MKLLFLAVRKKKHWFLQQPSVPNLLQNNCVRQLQTLQVHRAHYVRVQGIILCDLDFRETLLVVFIVYI